MSPSRIPTLKDVSRVPGQSRSRRPTSGQPQDLSKLKRATSEEAGGRNELAWLLVLDNVIDAGQAEARWLDQIGSRLTRHTTYAPKKRARGTAGSPIERSTESAPR